MRYKLAAILAIAICSLVGVQFAQADTGAAATATPWVYDPDGLGDSSSTWETAGGQNVLDLQKNAPTPSNEAAGATINGFADDPLFQLSFEYRGYCGAGAPRLNVYYGEQTAFFGCAHGRHTDLGDGWTLVDFTGTCDAGDGTNGIMCWYGPSDTARPLTVIDGADVVQDEGPAQVELRNITINDIVIGPPAPDLGPVGGVFGGGSDGDQRSGYCAATAVPRPGQDDGRFLDLLRGQNTQDQWAAYHAVPAYELADTGAITCVLPAGYQTTGQVDGVYPLAIHLSVGVPLTSNSTRKPVPSVVCGHCGGDGGASYPPSGLPCDSFTYGVTVYSPYPYMWVCTGVPEWTLIGIVR
jgi:hypothetical protein